MRISKITVMEDQKSFQVFFDGLLTMKTGNIKY